MDIDDYKSFSQEAAALLQTVLDVVDSPGKGNLSEGGFVNDDICRLLGKWATIRFCPTCSRPYEDVEKN